MTTGTRRMDRKLASILSGNYTADDFILADAKDADMAFGVPAPGPIAGAPSGFGPGRFKTRAGYLQDMGALVKQGELDILLTSASNGERMAPVLGSDITLAIRGNDTTDIWNQRGTKYPAQLSRPWRSANLEAIRPFCDLVLYSVTFNNDLDHDMASIAAYAEFRREAAAVDMRHFLEVFNPNVPGRVADKDLGAFVNDQILRTLAGVTSSERPIFLKMAFNGADAVSELVEYDPSIVVGLLGGSAGTTRDTFELLRAGEQAGARVALFGRKIQRAESQLDIVRLMRVVLKGELTPAEAVRAYHDALGKAGITPIRSLDADLKVTEPLLK